MSLFGRSGSGALAQRKVAVGAMTRRHRGHVWAAVAAGLAATAAAFSQALERSHSPAAPGSNAQPAKNEPPAAASPVRQMEQMIVTGTNIETQNQDVPADVRVVDEARLNRPGLKSALEALNEVSGVKLNPRQENALFSDVELRGLTGNATSGGNVLILLDGVPQRRLSFGGPYLGALPCEAIGRMELVKGAEASLYGRNALAGALQLFSGAGSLAPHYGVSAAYEWPTEDARASLRASGPLGRNQPERPALGTYALAGSFSHADGWQPGTERRRGDLYFHTDLNCGQSDQLSVFGGFVDGFEEMAAPVFVDANGNRLAGFARESNIAVPDHNSLDLQEGRIGLRYLKPWSDELQSKLTVAYWHGDTHWDVGRPDDQPATGTVAARPTDERDFLENSVFTELELLGKCEAADWWKGELSAGASYDYMTYDMTKTDITTLNLFNATGRYTMGIPFDLAAMQTADLSRWAYSALSERDTIEHNAGVFVRKQFTLWDRVHPVGGVRCDWFERTQENPATGERARLSDSAVSPSAGLSVALVKSPAHKLNLYGNYGLGFSPVFRAVNNTAFANVKPETSASAEVGVKASLWHGKLEGNAAVYQLERRDIVAMNPQTKLQENAGDWRIRGLETDWRLAVTEQVALFSSAAWRSPEIARYAANPSLAGNRIPAISDVVCAGGLEGRWQCGLSAGIQARYASSFYGNEKNSFVLPERTLCDAWVSYDWGKHVRVSVFLKNMFDAEYYTAVFNGVANGSAFEGTPRTVGLSLSRRF